jgi:hypothetical protein
MTAIVLRSPFAQNEANQCFICGKRMTSGLAQGQELRAQANAQQSSALNQAAQYSHADHRDLEGLTPNRARQGRAMHVCTPARWPQTKPIAEHMSRE